MKPEEEEQGVSYYLYSDETKKNFIRIFIDRDLKLIREIEVSNSPETLAGYQKRGRCGFFTGISTSWRRIVKEAVACSFFF